MSATGVTAKSFVLGLLFGNSPSLSLDFRAFIAQVLSVWDKIRAWVLAPLLNIAVFLCLMMTLMILLEKLVMGAVSLAVKVFRLKPERRHKWEPTMPDVESGNSAYPMVLVQIPMYNEKEVYKLSIGAACGLDWPREKMIIQVLDDSTDPFVKDLVKTECERWKNKGMNIHYEVRDNRKGYKAGALKEGMKHPYVQKCEFIAMFDADFQPEPSFLARAIPFLVHNSDIALVQARWKFVNADECMLTRIQEMSLDYHFKVEQEAGSSTFSFFGFNGTAGVWRISAIAEAGGWNDRTTVEDMDLAVRAGLQGWKFVYVGDIKVKSELPSTFKAYRFQQHRWSCGPANLFKKMAVEIATNKKVSIWKKLYILYSFFFVGKVVAHMTTFVFYCVVLPLSVWIPEVQIPLWGVAYVPLVISLCKSVGTPSSFHLVVFWVLFENVMSLHRLKAAMTGLLEVGRVNEWIVTEKLGDTLKTKPADNIDNQDCKVKVDVADEMKITIKDAKKPKMRFWHRFHMSELWTGCFLAPSAIYDVAYANDGFFVYLFLQAIAFFISGFDCVGTKV